jgi:hypothetical protein
MTASNAFPQRNLLPKLSSVYPDTFAIYWVFPNPPIKIKEDETFITCINSAYGDDVSKVTIDSFDTLTVTPFYSEWTGEQSLLVHGRYGKKDDENGYKPKGSSYVLRPDLTYATIKVIETTSKIAALLDLKQTKANVTNMLLLADAYEEEECFVNALYIYKRILLLDTKEGRQEWEAFCNRNYDKFRWQDKEGSVER